MLDDAGLHEDMPAPCADSQEVTVIHALYTPGLFHIFDGATKTILNDSQVWPDWKAPFEYCMQFFHRLHLRKMYVAACVSDPHAQGWSPLFHVGPPLFLKEGEAGEFYRKELNGF